MKQHMKRIGKKGLSMALAVLMTASLPFMELRIYAEVLEPGTEKVASEEPETEITEYEEEPSVDPASEQLEPGTENAAPEEPEAEITESEGEYSVDPASENIEMTTAAYMIYTNLGFNDPENWGLSYNRKNNNQITWMQDSGTGDGCIELNKCSSTDMYIDINELGLSSANIVFEQDVYLEDLHPNAVLFYLRDNVTIGSNVIATLAEISGDNLKIGDQTVGIECGRWNRISAAVDFANSKYDLYLNGLQVFSGMQLSGDMKNPALWRTYIGSDSPTGILRMDNMRVYDGKKPRALGESKTIYANLQFENTQEWGLSWLKTSGNSLNWTEYEETGSGYLLLEKTNTYDICLDINDLNLTSGYVVFEQDIYLGENHPSGSLFYLRDSKTTGSNVIVNLVEIVQGNLKIGDIRVPVGEEQWHRVSAVLDFINSRYDIYLDNILVFEEMGMNNNLKSPSLWRIYMYSGDNAGTIGYDNLRVYDGTEPRDIDAQKPLEKDIFSDEGALVVLNGRTALQPYGNAIFYNNRKEAVSGGIVMEGEEVLVAQAVFEKLFNVSVTVNDAVITVGDQVEFILDKKEMTVGGRNISIEASPRMDSGEVLLPICAYGKNVLPEGCFLDDGHGMYVVDSTAVNAADSRLKDANLYLFFERKNAEELKELLLANNDNNLTVHPRILADMDDFAALRDEVNTNDYKAAWFAQIRKRADSYLDQPVLEYQINNGRLLDVSNAALQRICDLGMSWQITNEQKYGGRLIAELENISSFRDWHPEHTLDTGTMAMAAAIAYDWGYDLMTENQRQEIGERLYRLGLVTAHEAYYGTASYPSWWTKTETNWGGVVNAGFLNLALAIAELDSDYAMDIVVKAKRSMEYTVYRIAPDGAWYEGPSYWSYLFQCLSYAMAGYESALGETDELVHFKGMEGYAKYQLYFSDPEGNVNNFHDSDMGPVGSYGMFYLAGKMNLPELMDYRADFMERQKQTATAFDLLWYDVNSTGNSSAPNLDLDVYYRETEFFSMRQNWSDENAMWVSAHGGSLNAAHDHIDAGSFVMNLGGVRWATDLPKEPLSYVPDTSNPAILAGYNSYYFYRRKGEGHNIVVINPDSGLEMDQSQKAEVVELVSGTGRSYAVIDLSDVYRQDVDSYLRAYLLSEGRRAFTVRDEIELKQSDSQLYWFMHTEGQIFIEDENTARIVQDGKQLKIQFLTNAKEYELSVMPAKKLPQSPQFKESVNPDVNKLALKLTGSGKITITVKMSLAGENASVEGPQDIPISEWTTAGDESVSMEGAGCKSRLNSILVNGVRLADFTPEKFDYVHSLSEKETTAKIIAEGEGQIEVISYPEENGMEMKEIRIYDDDGKYTSYIIMIEPYLLNQYIRHEVVNVWASSEQLDEGNFCEGSCDNNMDTRWSAEGDGEWCIHDLGKVQKIDAFGVALWKGAERRFYFDLEVSVDGETFNQVIEGYESRGISEEMEVIPLRENVDARYIRYVGHGNSVNQWNNVIELASYIKKNTLPEDDGGQESGEN